jgi:NAD-dependent SIR2 family protein deacetylase
LPYNIDKFKEHVENLEICKCGNCKGLIKPDVVFFGELLPERFFDGQ